jgi:myosin heavy subunit
VASILHVGNIDFKINNGGVGLVDTKDVEIVTKVWDFVIV